jgi:hypothetical protein
LSEARKPDSFDLEEILLAFAGPWYHHVMETRGPIRLRAGEDDHHHRPPKWTKDELGDLERISGLNVAGSSSLAMISQLDHRQ